MAEDRRPMAGYRKTWQSSCFLKPSDKDQKQNVRKTLFQHFKGKKHRLKTTYILYDNSYNVILKISN